MQTLKSSFAAIIILALSMSCSTTANAQSSFAKSLMKQAAKEAAKETAKELAKEAAKEVAKDIILNELNKPSEETISMTTTTYSVTNNAPMQTEVSIATTKTVEIKKARKKAKKKKRRNRMFAMIVESAL